MKEINFERKHFIKDLYNPKEVINYFNIIEFESFDVFKSLAEEGLFHIERNKDIIIPIWSLSEYKALIDLFKKTGANEYSNFVLYIPDINILEDVLKNLIDLKFQIMTDFDTPCMLFKYWNNNDNSSKWISNNRFYKRVKIDYNNYEKVLNRMINVYNIEQIRFFWLEINYRSFNEMKMGEIQDLIFSINHVVEYTIGKEPLVLYRCNEIPKRIYVSRDYRLYLNNERDFEWYFDLKKYKDADGCSVDLKDLNKLRSYADLKLNALSIPFNRFFNLAFIDFYYNLKMEGVFNQVPIISLIFDRWFTLA